MCCKALARHMQRKGNKVESEMFCKNPVTKSYGTEFMKTKEETEQMPTNMGKKNWQTHYVPAENVVKVVNSSPEKPRKTHHGKYVRQLSQNFENSYGFNLLGAPKATAASEAQQRLRGTHGWNGYGRNWQSLLFSFWQSLLRKCSHARTWQSKCSWNPKALTHRRCKISVMNHHCGLGKGTMWPQERRSWLAGHANKIGSSPFFQCQWWPTWSVWEFWSAGGWCPVALFERHCFLLCEWLVQLGRVFRKLF